MRLYLAGPMQKMPDFNFPAFHAAAAAWRSHWHIVFNPAESFNGRTDLPRIDYIREDLPELLSSDGVIVLPQWQKGSFASIEVAIARELGLPVYDARYPGQLTPYKETVLEEAERLVSGERGDNYGHPANDFKVIGRIWGAILGDGDDIPAETVALMMIGLKMARESYHPKRDNAVDIAGYSRCIERIREWEVELKYGNITDTERSLGSS